MHKDRFAALLDESIEAGEQLVTRGQVTTDEYGQWFNDASALIGMKFASGHPIGQHLYSAVGTRRAFAPDFGQGGPNMADDLQAKVLSLRRTRKMLDDVWPGDGPTPPSREPHRGSRGGTGVQVTMSPNIQASSHSVAVSSASASATSAQWQELTEVVEALPPDERTAAAELVRELRENLERDGKKERRRELIGSLLSKGADVALKLLPILLEHGPKLLGS